MIVPRAYYIFTDKKKLHHHYTSLPLHHHYTTLPLHHHYTAKSIFHMDDVRFYALLSSYLPI